MQLLFSLLLQFITMRRLKLNTCTIFDRLFLGHLTNWINELTLQPPPSPLPTTIKGAKWQIQLAFGCAFYYSLLLLLLLLTCDFPLRLDDTKGGKEELFYRRHSLSGSIIVGFCCAHCKYIRAASSRTAQPHPQQITANEDPTTDRPTTTTTTISTAVN